MRFDESQQSGQALSEICFDLGYCILYREVYMDRSCADLPLLRTCGIHILRIGYGILSILTHTSVDMVGTTQYAHSAVRCFSWNDDLCEFTICEVFARCDLESSGADDDGAQIWCYVLSTGEKHLL